MVRFLCSSEKEGFWEIKLNEIQTSNASCIILTLKPEMQMIGHTVKFKNFESIIF